MTRALIIGAGSIGIRHASVLSGLGHEVAFVTARNDLSEPRFATVAEAVTAFTPEYVVVSTETAAHGQSVASLSEAGFAGRLLIEKPLATDPAVLADFSHVGAGYNLRFHPALKRVAELLAGERVHTVEAYVGQHLSLWRPGRDARTQYSASRARGGGVLRDLAHEWDYLSTLFGPVRGLFARGGRVADVTEDSDDAWAIVTEFEHAPLATVQLNYLDTQVRRRLVVNFTGGTIEADLIAGTVRLNESTETFTVERDATYRAMHEAMLGSAAGVATAAEAARTDEVIALVERSASAGVWVEAS